MKKALKFGKDQWLALKLGSGLLTTLFLVPLIRWTLKHTD